MNIYVLNRRLWRVSEIQEIYIKEVLHLKNVKRFEKGKEARKSKVKNQQKLTRVNKASPSFKAQKLKIFRM